MIIKDKQLYFTLFSLGIVIICTITNPSYDDHRREVKKIMIIWAVEDEGESMSTVWSKLLEEVERDFVNPMLDNYFSLKNYVIFSLGILQRPSNDSSQTISIGFLGNVFTPSKKN